MTSSWSESTLLHGAGATDATRAPMDTDLVDGRWTRLGEGQVRGDAVTEASLGLLADRVRQAARAEGFSSGWAQGRRKAADESAAAASEHASTLAAERARYADQAEQALHAVVAATQRLDKSMAAACAAVESRAGEVALALTEVLLGRELADGPGSAQAAVLRALTLAPTGLPVVVRLNPADITMLAELGTNVPPQVSLTPDPSVQPGDAVAVSGATTVDATLGAALARVREVLLP
ncbi:MAG: FliH/SctL family protein [Nocardioidaceae bacterium]